ncbi:MAG: alpha-glucuronidase family glycosyl hydrolase [Sulfuricurvum sp.]|nr:alpha-glucuronidase family glycosyl hydrolase [Sulfuricurvum sp.]
MEKEITNKLKMKGVLLSIIMITVALNVFAESGYELWMRYNKIDDKVVEIEYKKALKNILISSTQPTLNAANAELNLAITGLLGMKPSNDNTLVDGTIIIGTPANSDIIRDLNIASDIAKTGEEGYVIKSTFINGKSCTVIAANHEIGALYGTFHFIRLLQTFQSISNLNILEFPKLKYRILNHWDNLNGTIERGYAGYTLWDWQRLPMYVDQRMIDYARANASVGINGTVLNNVNASGKSLSKEYLIKAAALANAFRPYGIKVYLTARFSAPIEIGYLKTADPLDSTVRKWWKDKADEIYSYIPDFGGFLVKANSEGQPGPQDYNRTHADGANMMAEALAPHGGIVMWRAFVYENNRHTDRAGSGYIEFIKLNGKFNKNVFVQPKNGAIDFQPREPFHPLFGQMPDTPLMPEFQITQEYLGYSTNLVYLAPLFKETLESDTYTKGKGTTVTNVIEDYQRTHGMSGIAAVPNIGTDINWTGHVFGQANWFAFGMLAWNPDYTSEKIAKDWIKMTFSHDETFIKVISNMMMQSRETAVDMRGALGLNHIMNYATHYGPGPWYKNLKWDAIEYHRADEFGLGVNRTATGSNVAGQYAPEVAKLFSNPETCPQKFLLYFNHVSWDYKMPSGRNLWEELVYHYYKSVEDVKQMEKIWDGIEKNIDAQRFNHVKQLLKAQEEEAIWWRDGSVLYFQTFSKRPIPAKYPMPEHNLNYYKQIPFPYDWKDAY